MIFSRWNRRRDGAFVVVCIEGAHMGEAVFHIAPAGDEWRLEYELEEQAQRVAYLTKEAAFEAAVVAATRAMREAHAVHITVDPAPNVLVGQDQNRQDQN
jgi:hypothetical protein